MTGRRAAASRQALHRRRPRQPPGPAGRTQAHKALIVVIKDDDTLAANLLRNECGAVIELNTSSQD
jgi:hypothetical protein